MVRFKKLIIFSLVLCIMIFSSESVKALSFGISGDSTMTDSTIKITYEKGVNETFDYQFVKITGEQYKAIENDLLGVFSKLLDNWAELINLENSMESQRAAVNNALQAYENNATEANRKAYETAAINYNQTVSQFNEKSDKRIQLTNEFLSKCPEYQNDNWITVNDNSTVGEIKPNMVGGNADDVYFLFAKSAEFSEYNPDSVVMVTYLTAGESNKIEVIPADGVTITTDASAAAPNAKVDNTEIVKVPNTAAETSFIVLAVGFTLIISVLFTIIAVTRKEQKN